MSSLQTRITDLITAIGTDYKQLRIWLTGSSSGTLTSLTTTAKSDVVSAINELNARPTGAINDAAPSASTTYSGTKTESLVASTSTSDRARANHTGTQSADTLTDGTTNKAFLATERTKLTGIATGATANSTDAVLEARANHTGTQLASTISDFSTAADARITIQKAAANGLASLDSGGKVPSAQLPAYVDDVLEYATVAALPATGATGVIYVITSGVDINKEYRWSGTQYVQLTASPGTTDNVPEGTTNLYYTTARSMAASPIQTVSGRAGNVVLTKADVSLANVDNTSDVNKPVSTAQAAADALNLKIAANLGDVPSPATALGNLGGVGTAAIGNPDTDLVALYTTAKS